jgi:hydantoinase/carbamoylase family amidase
MTRLDAELAAVARFGGGTEGITRTAWSPELMQALRWLRDELDALGCEAEIDAAGNVVGRWATGSGPAVVVGSHLDTVPQGGRYDGALGVLAGLDALRRLRANGFEPRRPIWLVAFMDEEGARFGTSLFGSQAFVGEDMTPFGSRTDADGLSVRDAMRGAGFDLDATGSAARIAEVGAYVELHIEQGPVLETGGDDIGVVTAITGVMPMRARLEGRAGHAGTTPMTARQDALVGAARAITELRALGLSDPDTRVTVGRISVAPGAANVIPGVCEFTIDVRSPRAEELDRLEAAIAALLGRIAAEDRLEHELTRLHRIEPLALDPGVVESVAAAAEALGARTRRMPSAAGHDAMIVGRHVPAGMIFVPSRDGMSHHPSEYTSPEACELGARVLAGTLERLAG